MTTAQTWTILCLWQVWRHQKSWEREKERERERGCLTVLLLLHLRLGREGRGVIGFHRLPVTLAMKNNVKYFFKMRNKNILKTFCLFDVWWWVREVAVSPVTVVTPDPTTTNPGLYGGSARRPPLPPSAMDTLSSPWIVNNQSSQSVGTQDPSETTTGPLTGLIWAHSSQLLKNSSDSQHCIQRFSEDS